MTKPRTLSGLVVPFGKPGRTSVGTLHFDDRSLTWSAPERVKLLLEHDPGTAIGHGVTFEARADGLYGTFAVDDSPLATAALASASRMVRDGLSVGVELADEVGKALARDPHIKGGTRGAGQLREVSLCAVPAFDDARVDDVAGVDATTKPPAAAAAPITPGGNMPNLATAAAPRLATASRPLGLHVAAGALASTQAAAAAAEGTATAGGTTTEPAAPAGVDADLVARVLAALGQAPAQTPPAAPAAAPAPEQPAAPPAVHAGAVTTVTDAPVYTFDGRGDSFARDVFAAQAGDLDAMARLSSFQRAMQDDQSRQLAQVAGFAARVTLDGKLAEAAVEVRDAGNAPLRPDVTRPDLMLRAIDVGRPLTSRLLQVPISGPDPFRYPNFGLFDGVADHVEGTAHVTEGVVDNVAQGLVTPTGVSGAFRMSRELAESKGPSMDQLVLSEMVVDYRKNTEAKLVAVMELAKPTYDAVTVNTAALLNGHAITFLTTRQEAPGVIAFGTTGYATFANLVASDGRPYYPYLGPTNAGGTSSAGFAALNIQGIPGVPAWSARATDVWMAAARDVATFESPPRLFRFEEVEGPGIIKLAIWGYQAAHVSRVAGLRRLKTVA